MIYSITRSLIVNIIISVYQYHINDLLIQHWCQIELIKKILGTYHKNFYQEINYRFNAITHATITSILSSLYLIGMIGPEIISTIFVNSMGYCIYDLYLLYSTKHEDHLKTQFIVHHSMMLIILFMNYSAQETHLTLIIKGLLAEWSTIFINLSIIMYRIGLSNSQIFKLNSWITVFTFLGFRILLYPSIISQTFPISFFYGFLTIIFYLLNCVWFFKIVQNHLRMVVNCKTKKFV